MTTVEVHGHACKLSETNGYGWVFLCECGEVGTVQQVNRSAGRKGRPSILSRELARSAAQDDHDDHLRAVQAQLAADADRALADHGRRIDLANAVLQRRGRWGQG